jgi:hypothetical protein
MNAEAVQNVCERLTTISGGGGILGDKKGSSRRKQKQSDGLHSLYSSHDIIRMIK